MRTISSSRQIGQVIRDKREKLSMTQQQLADAAGVSRGFISRIEKGASIAVYPDKLLDVLKTMGLTMQITDSQECHGGNAQAETTSGRSHMLVPVSGPDSEVVNEVNFLSFQIDPALLAPRNANGLQRES